MSGRKILRQGQMEYFMWLSNPRMAISLVLLVLIHSLVIQPLHQAARDMGQPIHLLEPLAALANSPLILLLLPVGFLVLMADFPRMDAGFLLQLYRTGRVNWALGELVMLCAAAATYLAGVALATLLLTMLGPWSASMEWSYTVTEYSWNFDLPNVYTVASLLPKNLYQQMSLFTAVWKSWGFVFLYLVLGGCVMMAASMLRMKFAGILFNAAVMLSGTGLVLLGSEWMWLLPCAHTLVWAHHTEYFSDVVFPQWGSLLYFVVGILLLSAIALWRVRRRDFDSVLEFT